MYNIALVIADEERNSKKTLLYESSRSLDIYFRAEIFFFSLPTKSKRKYNNNHLLNCVLVSCLFVTVNGRLIIYL